MTAIPPGENAEDCPHCDPTDPAVAVYPWICPGHPDTPDDEAEKAPESVVRIDLDVFRGLVDVAHNLGRTHADSDQYAAMQLVVRQAPALLALVAEQAATIAHYDTALIEATRDLDRARRHIADLDGQIEGQDQALNAADADRDTQAAEIERLVEYRRRLEAEVAVHVTGVALAETTERADRAEARVAELEADPGRGMPTRGDWRLARDRTRAAEHAAEQLEAELAEARAENERLRADRDRMHLALAQERHERAEAAEWPDDEPVAPEVVTVSLDTAGLPPLYPPRVEWVVQVRDPDGWDAEADGWEGIGPPHPTREDAHARADRRRACRDAPEVRVIAVERTYRLDASRAPESPAGPAAPPSDTRRLSGPQTGAQAAARATRGPEQPDRQETTPMSTTYEIPALTRSEVSTAQAQQRRPADCTQCANGTPVDHWPSPTACTSSYRRDDNGVERLFRVHCTCDYCF